MERCATLSSKMQMYRFQKEVPGSRYSHFWKFLWWCPVRPDAAVFLGSHCGLRTGPQHHFHPMASEYRKSKQGGHAKHTGEGKLNCCLVGWLSLLTSDFKVIAFPKLPEPPQLFPPEKRWATALSHSRTPVIMCPCQPIRGQLSRVSTAKYTLVMPSEKSTCSANPVPHIYAGRAKKMRGKMKT